MQIKLLEDIVIEIAGKQAEEIVNILFGKKDINEFLVAKKLKLTINQTRNIFYKLSNFGLVSFTRKKDKRKGWYTYFWTLNPEKALELLENKLKKEMETLQQQLKSREIKRFYFCETCKVEVSEENALLHNFVCQECGSVYKLQEDTKILNNLKNSVLRLERQRENVVQELNEIREEKARKSAKMRKKEKKKKLKKARKKTEKKKKKRKKKTEKRKKKVKIKKKKKVKRQKRKKKVKKKKKIKQKKKLKSKKRVKRKKKGKKKKK